MVDVVFTLLVFFAVLATTSAYNQGMKLQLPAAASVSNEKKGVVLSIDAEGHFYLDKEPIDVAVVRQRVAEQMKNVPETQIILNADKTVPYTLVIQALDEVRLGGCFDVVLEAEQKIADGQ